MDNLVVNAVAPWVGYLQWVGNIREGQGKNGPYAFADFTLKYSNSKLEEKYITFTVSNVEQVEFLKGLDLGTALRVSWFPDTSEFSRGDDTRWYPSLRAYNIGLAKVTEPAKPAQPSQPAPAPVKHAAPKPQSGYAPVPVPPLPPEDTTYDPTDDEDGLPF